MRARREQASAAQIGDAGVDRLVEACADDFVARARRGAHQQRLVGAIIFMVARDQFSGVQPQYWYFWIGVLLVVVVMFLPNGVLGGLSKIMARWGYR